MFIPNNFLLVERMWGKRRKNPKEIWCSTFVEQHVRSPRCDGDWGQVIATICREQRNTSSEVAAVTVKLTPPVPSGNMLLLVPP